MIVRQCEARDVDLLEQHIPSPGQNRYHEDRFTRQQQGLSTFLVADLDGVPVGSGELLWRGCGNPGVRERFPDCPELSGLNVMPERQSRGIGTALVRAAEALATDRGKRWIGLGVDDQNARAAALYLRLGFQDHGCHYLDRYPYIDADGVRRQAADPCRFLVKELR